MRNLHLCNYRQSFMLLQLCLTTKIILTQAGTLIREPEPEFVEPVKNVTVHAGREAVLSCVVAHLGNKNLGWIRQEDQTILTLGSRVISHNNRITVVHDNDKTWSLHISKVREQDRGCYMCQLNTPIMMKQLGCIDVHVSPQIIDNETSTDITVREGDNATLFCKARGHPAPRIVWKREDGQKIRVRSSRKSDAYKEYENITSISIPFVKLHRSQMGTFLCIASNDVPPAVSKRITLDVTFEPLIRCSNQIQGVLVGSTVELTCRVESCPKAFVYWQKNHDEMLLDGYAFQNSTKYKIEEHRVSYIANVTLKIFNFERKDVGIYKIFAVNSAGKAEAEVRTHEIKLQKTTNPAENQVVTRPGYATPPATTKTTTKSTHRNRNYYDAGYEGQQGEKRETNSGRRRTSTTRPVIVSTVNAGSTFHSCSWILVLVAISTVAVAAVSSTVISMVENSRLNYKATKCSSCR